VRPGFAVTPANAQSVLLLCQRLDGIPLALELAAAKLSTLSPAQVIASIGRRIDLATDRPAVPERHRSLEAVLDWSLGLLADEEREAFACLSVCRGGLNSQLATELLGERADDYLFRLCKCSLLGWSETSDEVRFAMLETVREMAAQLLAANGALRAQAVERHFTYVHRLCTAVNELSDERKRAEWVETVVAESGNVLAALESASEGGIEAERAWEMALTLALFIERRGRPQMWVGPLTTLLQATSAELQPATSAKAHLLLSRAFYGLRDIRATYDLNIKAIEAADRSGDPWLRIDTRAELATPAITIGAFPEAQKALEEATELLPLVSDPAAAARCYLNLGWVVFDGGMESDSEPIFRQAYELAQQSDDNSTLGSATVGLACAIGHTRYEEARPLFEHALSLWSAAGVPGLLAHCYYFRALIDYRHGKLDEALANVTKAVVTFVDNGIALGQTPLTVSGNLMAGLGRFKDAASCWGKAEAARRRHGMLMLPTVNRDYERELARARAALSPAELQLALDNAAKLSDEGLAERLFGVGARVALV
jgi:tetratricopeptide (TPR) repeat protein